jgi:predicted permease
MIKVLGDALAPIFAGLLLGYFAGLWRRMDNQNVRTMITFVMSFAVPCSMFLTIARTPRAELREQGGAALVLTIVYVVLYALTFVWARSQEKLGASESSVLALTVSFPSSAAVGLALLASVFGPKSLVTVATSIALGSITVSAITLAILEAKQDPSAEGFSSRRVLFLCSVQGRGLLSGRRCSDLCSLVQDCNCLLMRIGLSQSWDQRRRGPLSYSQVWLFRLKSSSLVAARWLQFF